MSVILPFRERDSVGKRWATRQDLICLHSSRRWAVTLFRSKRAGRDGFASRRQRLDSFLVGLCRQWERLQAHSNSRSYSMRNVSMGLIRVARRVGKYDAASAARTTTARPAP